jgi:AmiR/NasT family two-component response regulator
MYNEDLDPVPWTGAPIYWAQGFLAQRLDITVEEADRRLRAHADKTRRALLEVALDVVEFGLLADNRDYR